MLHRLILKVRKFQLPTPIKRLSTVVKNILGAIMHPMSNRVKQSIKEKHILFKNFIPNRTAENETKYEHRKAEANYFKSKFNNKQNGIREMWQHLGYILCPK